MKYEKGSIKLNKKEYTSIEAGYEGYEYETDSINVSNKTFTSTQAKGVENVVDENLVLDFVNGVATLRQLGKGKKVTQTGSVVKLHE